MSNSLGTSCLWYGLMQNLWIFILLNVLFLFVIYCLYLLLYISIYFAAAVKAKMRRKKRKRKNQVGSNNCDFSYWKTSKQSRLVIIVLFQHDVTNLLKRWLWKVNNWNMMDSITEVKKSWCFKRDWKCRWSHLC